MTYSFINPNFNVTEAEPMAIAMIMQVAEYGIDHIDGTRIYVCDAYSIHRTGDRYTILDAGFNELFQFQATQQDIQMLMQRQIYSLQRLLRRRDNARKQKAPMPAATALIQWGTEAGLL